MLERTNLKCRILFIFVIYVCFKYLSHYSFQLSARERICWSDFGSLISVCPSVWMEHIISNWMTFREMEGCCNLPRKYNLVKIGEKLQALYMKLVIISRWILLGMGKVSYNICGENWNTRFISDTFFRK
jgi:hypothetical protein